MMIKNIITILLFLLWSISALAQDHKEIKQGDTLIVQAKIGVEKVIKFPEPIKRSVLSRERELFTGSLISNSFYFTPKQEFRKRILFQGIESGEVYVLDIISASEPVTRTVTLHRAGAGPVQLSDKPATKKVITAVDLVQYAAQILFAPDLAMVEGVPNIREVAIEQNPVEKGFYFGGRFEATPFRSWTAAGMYVTAVEFKNNMGFASRWSVCDLNGKFSHAAPHSSIENPVVPQGGALMVYLISEVPFQAASSVKGRSCLN